MNEIINNLNKAITEGKTRELMEAKIAENLKEAIFIPEFYKLGLEVLNEILDKCDTIDPSCITTIIGSGYKYFGNEASVLLPHIKCTKFNELVNKETEVDAEAAKEIERILVALEFIPIIKEIRLAMHEMLNVFQSISKKRLSYHEEGDFEADWEAEYKEIKEEYELREKEMLITKQLKKKSVARIIEGDEREKITKIIKDRNVNELIDVLLNDPSLLNGDILHICAENEWKEGIEKLLNIYHIDRNYVNRKNISGFPPLIYVSDNEHLDVVEYLLSKGARIEERNKKGDTPLLFASRNGELEAVEYLIEKGANIEAKNFDGDTPLALASQGGHIEVVKYLIEKGADIETRNNTRNTPLFAASSYGHLEVVEYLISKGANIKGGNKNGDTPLIFASLGGHLEVVKFLLFKKANVKARNNNGDTPLMFASCNGHLEVVKYLISSGADVKAMNNSGDTPLKYAKDNGQSEVVKYLKSLSK